MCVIVPFECWYICNRYGDIDLWSLQKDRRHSDAKFVWCGGEDEIKKLGSRVVCDVSLQLEKYVTISVLDEMSWLADCVKRGRTSSLSLWTYKYPVNLSSPSRGWIYASPEHLSAGSRFSLSNCGWSNGQILGFGWCLGGVFWFCSVWFARSQLVRLNKNKK